MPLGPAAQVLQTCSSADCTRPALARGLCRLHYTKLWRQGLLPTRRLLPPLTHVKFLLPTAHDKLVRKLARLTGQSVNELLRSAVAEYLTRNNAA